jgi:hypothetical protein
MTQAIVVTLLAEKVRTEDGSWKWTKSGPKQWLIAREFDATSCDQAQSPDGVLTLIETSQPRSDTMVLYGVAESVEEIANLCDARRNK